jgi:hypothetical protein
MATTSVISISDGPRTTVADLIGSPMMVPTRLKEMMTNVFISESLLRNAGPNPAGLVGYSEGDPSFLDSDVQDVAEFGEIPVAAGRMGVPRVAVSVKRALGVRVSREMRDENRLGAVQKQMMQLRNTFVRADSIAAKALINAGVPTMPVSNAWDSGTGTPRRDIADAIFEVTQATPATDIASPEEWYGFQPDIFVYNPGLFPVLMDNEDFVKVYQGNIANENLNYTGVMPGRVHGLIPIASMSWPIGEVLIAERGTIGFYSDTRPLEFTGLYPEGNGPNGGPRETWRADSSHKRAMALDQPKAGIRLTGLVTP